MKRTSINILCILIVCILFCSMVMPAVYIGLGFTEGVKTGYGSYEETEMANTAPLNVCFGNSPSRFINPSDSVTFDNGETYPVCINSGMLSVPVDKVPVWSIVIASACSITSFVIFIFLVISFVKFIIDINKDRIFVRKNVKRLRRVAIFLITIALLQCASGITSDIAVAGMGLTENGYPISSYWTMPWSNLLLGLLALLVAQVWMRAIEMKEEQELTI